MSYSANRLAELASVKIVSEFDAFAPDYQKLVDDSVRLSGESSAYFAAYKAGYIGRILERRSGVKVLDYGCGIGLLSRELKKNLTGALVDGFDVSADSIQQVDADLRREGRFTSTFSELDSIYDVVVVANVLHHVDPAQRRHVIQEAGSKLATGGRLVLFEHNPLNPLTRRAVSECPFDRGAILLRAHAALKCVREGEMRVLARDYIVFFPRQFAWLRSLEPLLGWCPLGAQYAVVAERVFDEVG